MIKKQVSKFFIFFFISFSIYSANSELKKPEMEFVVQASSTEASYLNVDLNFINYPDPANVVFTINPDTMEKFLVYDLTNKRIRYQISNNQLKISGNNKSFFIKYRSKISNIPSNIEKYKTLDNLYSNETILFFGYNTFIYPVFSEKFNISPNIYIKFLFPKLWKLASSWGINKKNFKISDIQSLQNGITIAGNLEIEKILVKSKPYYLLFQGKWNDIKSRFISVYKSIALEQIKYWNFMPSDFVLVNLFKSSKFNITKGINYANTLLYFLPEYIDLKNVEFLKLIAHEHFHIWNGYYLFPYEGKEGQLLWFKEGLTDYYALMTLVNAGLISSEEFLNNILELYIKYNSETKLDDTLKGFFIFLALDMEIRKGTNNLKSLNNFIKNISLRSEFWQRGYTLADIKSELLKLYYCDISDFFDKFLNNNNKINIDAYFSFLGISSKKDISFSYTDNFDISTYKSGTNYVSSIKDGCDAYEAGLRKKDIIINYNKALKYPKKSLITIKDKKTTKDISFNPWQEIEKLILVSDSENEVYKKWIKGN